MCSRRRRGGCRRRNHQVEVSWTEEALVQRTELNHYLLMDTQRPAFMTKQETTVLQLRRGEERRIYLLVDYTVTLVSKNNQISSLRFVLFVN